MTQYPVKQNPKIDTTVESQVSKNARPGAPPVFLCQHLRTTRVILAPEMWATRPDGNRCNSYTRGILQRDHAIAGQHRYCGKEFKRKLEHGPVDHEIDFKCRVYENGRVAADAETLRQLAGFSERHIRQGSGVRRDTIRLLRHGKGVKRSTYQKITTFLNKHSPEVA